MVFPYQDADVALRRLTPRTTRTGDPKSSLEGVNTFQLPDGALCIVQEPDGADYQFFRASTAAPDGDTIIEPTAGPGRWFKRTTLPTTVCLLPLFRTIYVDGNTTTAPVDQNGTISCPYDGIQKALDTIPPLSGADPAAILADARQGFVILIAPGIYSELITMPLIGRMIILRATGGLAQPSFAPIGTPSGLGPIEGPPVRIEGAETGLLMDYSFLTGVSTETSICPYYQFEGLFIELVVIDAGAVDPDVLAGCLSSYRDCWIVQLSDEKNIQKYVGQLDFRNTFVALIGAGEAGLLAERSHFGSVDVGRAQGQDSVFDELEQFAADFPSLESSVMMHDCEFTTDYSAFDSPPTKHDGVTEYLASLVGALSTAESRRVQDLVGNGYWKLQKLTFGATSEVMFPDVSAAVLTNPNAAARTFVLPGLVPPNGADYSHASAGGAGSSQMSRVIMVKSSSDSDPLGIVTLDPSSTTTIEGAATRPLSPGESLILLPDGAANNWEIVASFP